MIVLRNLTKVFVMQGRRKVVADNINAVFPTGTSVGLLGRTRRTRVLRARDSGRGLTLGEDDLVPWVVDLG